MQERMNAKQLEALKTTFPWRTEVQQVGAIGGLVKMFDRNGNEVPIFDMTGFLEVVTLKMAPEPAKETQPPIE